MSQRRGGTPAEDGSDKKRDVKASTEPPQRREEPSEGQSAVRPHALSATPHPPRGDGLPITALYTAGVWAWAGVEGADLFFDQHSLSVRRAVNGALAVARLFRPRLPRVPEGLAQRRAAIDQLMVDTQWGATLELAAGLSPRASSARRRWPQRPYLEIDLPPLLDYKRALLAQRQPALLRDTKLRMIDGQVGQIPLAPLCEGLPGPLLVVAEGLLMYLKEDAQRALFKEVSALLAHHGGAFFFDLVPAPEQPPPGFIGRVLGAMMRRFTGGESFTIDQRGREEILKELLSAGFSEASCGAPAELLSAEQLPFPEVHTQQLIFSALRPLATR